MCGGIIVGALALLLLGKAIGCAVRRHRYMYGRCGGYAGYGGWGGGCGGGHDHHREGRGGRWGRRHGPPGGFRENVGKRWMLRWIYERLDTTPGQEKVIAQSFDVIREALSRTKDAFAKTRSTIAGAVRGDDFGHEEIGEAWVAHDLALEKARLEIVSELQKVHDALDERQRKIFADLIESGPGFFGGRFERDEEPRAGKDEEGSET